MALEFGEYGYENLFKQSLVNGINLFCGAGFSVEAIDKNGKCLPVGDGLLEELKELFPSIKTYTKLPRACTKLVQTDKGSFYSFLRERFTVDFLPEIYNSLLNINIKNVYTTNIDDLFLKLIENADNSWYLNDRSVRGAEYISGGKGAYENHIDYFPLHGCVCSSKEFVFGATEIASAFSKENTQHSWASLAKDAGEHSILFWGWNFEDSGPLEAMYGSSYHINENTKKWALLHKPTDETIDFLLSLNFNIIIGDTKEMLQYLSEFVQKQKHEDNLQEDNRILQELKQYSLPEKDTVGSYPLKLFYRDYIPRWSYVYSRVIPCITYYKKIADWIAAGKDVIITGIRCSGKTTLLMQLAAYIETIRLIHYMIAPTLEVAKLYLKSLHGKCSVLFIDDCFRDTDALIKLINANNVQVICCDRDFNYERQFHKIANLKFESVDITELSLEDAQAILNIIPSGSRKDNANTKNFQKDPTLPNLLATTLKKRDFKFMKFFYDNDMEAARVFLMVCYVHSCGVPCSFDMVYSFLGDDRYTWEQMMDIVHRAGKLIKECEDSSEYFGSYDINFSLQSYYECRSRYFAQTIIESLPEEDDVFASVLFDFVESVPPFKICSYDKFKRSGYDADLACRAFKDFSKGKRYYETCALKDESEYIYQQAAIYFSRKKQLKEAFLWIERARNLAHYNRFSIDSTYAMIYFNANVGIDYSQCKEALNILKNCCTSDKRKSIHFATFAKCVLQYAENHFSEDKESVPEYINCALKYVEEGLDTENISLRTKNKWELRDLKKELEVAKETYVV